LRIQKTTFCRIHSPFIDTKWPNLAGKENASYKLLLWRAMDTKIFVDLQFFVSFVVYARTTVMHSKSASVDTPRQSGGLWVGILLSSVTRAILYYALYSLRTFFSFLWSGASNVTRSMTPAMKAFPFRLQNNNPPSRAYWHIRW